MQALLRFPGMGDDRRWLSLLAPLDVDAEVGAVVITPRRLHEHMPTVTVAGLGDGALPFGRSARIFARAHTERPRCGGERLSWAIQWCAALQLVREKLMILPNHQAVRGRER